MNRKRVEIDDAVAIDVEAKNIFRALVESISTSSTEYWYKLVGEGPECLSTFLNFQNSNDWLEVLSLIGVYNKEQGRYLERKLTDIGIMEGIVGKSELNTFNLLSKESYDLQITEKKKFLRAKKEWFIKLGHNNQSEISARTSKNIPKDQYNKKRYHFLVVTPPTLRLNKSQTNLVKELLDLARLSTEQKQFEKDKLNDSLIEREASSKIVGTSKETKAEEPQPMQNETSLKQGSKRLPCDKPAAVKDTEQPKSKKPRLGVVSNQPPAVPEHIVAAKALASRLSGSSLKEYHLKGKLTWKNSNKPDVKINSTHRRKAAQIEFLLNTVASQDIAMVSCILRCLLEKNDFQSVRTDLQECWRKEKNATDTHIVKNIREFLKYHKNPKGGTLHSTLAAAVEAVETAVMFPCGESQPPVQQIAESIGYSRGRPATRLLEIRAKAVATMDEGKQFEPSTRAVRVDCYLDKAAQSVIDFSHSDEASRTDTNSYRVYEIRDPDNRKEVLRKCEQRVWNEVTWKNRYEAFLKSLVYTKFLADEKKTICYKTFRKKACICVKTPCPSSCVDLLLSGLGHYMKALKDAIVSRPTIAQRLETCCCKRHTAH
jgi:hypothetical protein